jgi:hypothetical protein
VQLLPFELCFVARRAAAVVIDLTIFGRWVLHIRVKFHAAWGRRARAA